MGLSLPLCAYPVEPHVLTLRPRTSAVASHIFSVQNFKSHVTSVVHKELDVTHALMDGIAAAQKEGGHNPTDAVNLCGEFDTAFSSL